MKTNVFDNEKCVSELNMWKGMWSIQSRRDLWFTKNESDSLSIQCVYKLNKWYTTMQSVRILIITMRVNEQLDTSLSVKKRLTYPWVSILNYFLTKIYYPQDDRWSYCVCDSLIVDTILLAASFCERQGYASASTWRVKG